MTIAAPSHINSRVALAQHMVALGHRVGWLCTPSPDPRLARLGVEVLALSHPPQLVRTTGSARMQMVVDEQAELANLRRVFLGAFLEQVDAVREVIRAFRPDVIALDGCCYHFVVGAQLEQVPWGSVSSGLWLLQPRALEYPMLRIANTLADERLAFFGRYGMRPDFRLFECLSPTLNIVATTQELVDGSAEWPAHTVAVGPMIPKTARGDEVEFPWERLRNDRPIVYLAMGTAFYWNPEIVRDAAIACADLGAQLVASVLDLADHDTIRSLPGDPVIARYVPQLELLAKATAFITHGGASSVMEALSFGVPQVVVPMSLDQPLQAYFVTRAGAGVTLERTEFTAATCRDALAPILDPSSTVRRRAAAIGESYRAADGPGLAAKLLLSLVGSTPKQLPSV